MKVRSSVNRGGLKIGEVYDVTVAHARSLVAQGIATIVDEKAERAPSLEPHTPPNETDESPGMEWSDSGSTTTGSETAWYEGDD
jgi:hypothetical protein